MRFTDNSVLRLTLREDKIPFVTAYGKLLVPVADIVKIELATRLSDEVARQIETALRRLGSDAFAVREQASAELLKLGGKAYPALLDAAKSGDGEVRRRARDLSAQIKQSLPPELLEVRRHDVLYTKDCKFTGKIDSVAWQANTSQFGAVQVKLADVHALRSLALAASDERTVAALPDPGTLANFANQLGKKLAFTVTGRADGTVWGTGAYTLDSTLGLAAVHAGILKVGQTGVVKLEIVASPPAFAASTQNGVTSMAFGFFPSGAYQFIREANE
jgi:hypothetical protein